MKRVVSHFAFLFALFLVAVSCVDDEFGSKGPNGGEGTLLRFSPEQMMAIETRSAPPHMAEAESKVEWVSLYVFDNVTGELLAFYGQEMDYPDNELRLILPSGRTLDIHAVCNAQDWFADDEITKRSDLESKVINISNYDDVFKGKYIMYGHTPDVTQEQVSNRNGVINVPVARLGSHITFDIKFAPENSYDKFYLTNIIAYNLPRKSNLLKSDISDGSEYNRNSGDVVHPTGELLTAADSALWREKNYFNSCRLSVENPQPDHYTIDFFQFENRRGELTGDKWFAELPDSDPNKADKQQIFKARYGDSLFYFASYIEIKGTYVTNSSVAGVDKTMDVTYKVYLGSSNDRDYNVKRNGKYHFNTTIRSCDEIDTRVESILRTEPSLTPTFEVPLDAHYNTSKCFMFAPDDWEIYVENADKTPWLEISFSPQYKPHLAGMPYTEDCASTRLEGEGRRLDYFYIHTDEYIPYLDGYLEQNNDHYAESKALRKGIIVLRSKKNGTETRIPITQRPAQIVRLKMKDGERLYYVESLLEKKDLPWGFEECIDPPLMMQSALGWWDGLANTRDLYQSALDPEQWLVAGQKPYYNQEEKDWKRDSTVRIPDNIALGYALSKNRDRDGNGRIDYDEIVWYIPATDELYELLRVCNRDKFVWYQNAGDKFWTSQVFSGGSIALNGRTYYIKTGQVYKHGDNDILRRGSYSSALRERRYNVLCVRLAKESWQGNSDGSIGTDVDIDDTWKEEDEIMPKK